MNVLVRRVRVPGGDKLILREAHVFQVRLRYFFPLRVRKRFPRSKGQADVADGPRKIGPQSPHLAELPRQFTGRFSRHVGIQLIAFALA